MPKKSGKKKGGKGKEPAVKEMTIEEFRGKLKDGFKADAISDLEQRIFLGFIDSEVETREKDSEPLKVLLAGNISSSAIASFCKSLCQARKENFKMVNVVCFSNANVGEEGTKAIAKVVEQVDSLNRLELLGCRVPSVACIPLGLAIERNSKTSSSLRKLNLSYNKIGTAGLTQLVTGFTSNKAMEELILSYCDLDSTSGLALMKLIKGCPSLKKLDLTGNRLGARGLQFISQAIINCGSGLEELKFSLNCVGEEDLEHSILVSSMDDLAELLRKSSLSILDLSGNCFPEEFGECLFTAYEEGKVAQFSIPHNWKNAELYKSFQKIRDKRGGKKKKKGKGGKKKKKK